MVFRGTLKLYDANGVADLPTMTSVEKLELINSVDSLDLSTISALTHLTIDNGTSGKTYTIAGTVATTVKNIADSEIVDLTYAATDTTSTVSLTGFGTTAATKATLDLNGAAITTVALTSSSTANYAVLTVTGGAATTLTVAGDIALNLDATGETSLTSINASTMTAGGLTIDVGASANNTSITGSGFADVVTATAAVNYTIDLGAGDDMLTTGDATGEITSADTLNGGAGAADILAISSVVASEIAASDAIQAKITNFEQLRITDNLNHDFDISQFGINYLQLADALTADKTVSGFSSGATIELRDAAAMTNDLTVTITDATNTANTSDTLNLFLNADIADADAHNYGFDIAGIETISVNAVDRDNTDNDTEEDDGYVLDLDGNDTTAGATNDSDLTTLNIQGSAKVSYTATTGTDSLTTVNGSSSTAELVINLDAIDGTTGVTITGGTKDDDIDGSDGADTINGGAGTDNLDGSEGNDIFIISSVSESFADTIVGGNTTTDNDTLQIAAAAVGTGGITQNLIDFATSTNTILNNVAFTATTPFSGVENVDTSAVTNSLKIVGDTQANKITTGTAADTIKLNAGADIVIVTATNSVDGKEDSILDFSTAEGDILRLTGNHGSSAIALDNLTVTDNGDTASNTWQYTDLGTADIILQVGTAGTGQNLTANAQLGDATTVNSTSEVTFTTNATTVVASANADYINLGTAVQTVSLGASNDVVVIASGGSNNGSEDTISDFADGADTLILTGSNTVALDLGEIVDTQVAATTSYELVLGSSHVIFTGINADDGTGTNEDMKDSIQLGTSSNAFSTTANVTAGNKNDIIQSGSAGQTIKTGTGNNTVFYNSASSDASGTASSAEAVTFEGTTDTIVVAGGTTAVDFSVGDTWTASGTNIVLELTKNIAGTADTNAQSLTMNNAQVDMLTTINASNNGTTGDTITLKDAMVATMLNNTFINGTLKIKLGDFDNDLTIVAETTDIMDATTDVLYIDGSGMTSTSSELTFNGATEEEATFVIIGGKGNDVITAGGQGADTFTLGTGLDVLNYTHINQFGDTYTDFTSPLAVDTIQFINGMLLNGTPVSTLESITSSGTIGANTVFLEITDSVSSGAADTAAEVVTAMTNLTYTNIVAADSIIIALNDGTDTYLWNYIEAATAKAQAGELTMVAKLTGVTDVTDGDFVSL